MNLLLMGKLLSATDEQELVNFEDITDTNPEM